MNSISGGTALGDFLESRRGAVNRALESWLPTLEGCPASLARAMHYAVFPGGKRLRPMLALLAGHACGGDDDKAMAPAVAVELVHCYSLVHDDLPAMDDDDLRRGRPTVHKAFGEAIAILAGDALLTLAFGVLARHCHSADLAAACCRELAGAAGALGMVGGQMDDIQAQGGEKSATATNSASSLSNQNDFEMLQSIHARKTGALLSASLRMGALSAGAGADLLAALNEYGRRIGLLFQITDDLLDVQGSETAMGKRVGKDGGRGKLTFPGVIGTNESHRQARELCRLACDALEPLGRRGELLQQMAWQILERDR